jgi:hypothetical protein
LAVAIERCWLALAMILGVLVQPAAAQAAPLGGVYGITPTWGGWCGGSRQPERGQHLTMTVKCKIGDLAMNYKIKPARNKQPFWFRLDGSVTNN